MKTRTRSNMLSLAALLALLLGLTAGLAQATSPSPALAPVGAGFTYQGHLKDNGAPVSGTCDLQFALWDAESGGAQVGPTLTAADTSVTDGRFTTRLDFGSAAFDGEARWLAIAARCPAGGGSYTPLTPRQPLTTAPYALYTLHAPWTGITAMPAGFADGIDDDTLYQAGEGLVLDDTTFSVSEPFIRDVISNTYIDASMITGTISMTLLPGEVITQVKLTEILSGYQQLVTGVCGAGYAIRLINPDGTVVCEQDTDTTYSAGTGLQLVGTVFSVDFAGSGTAGTAARSDHDHGGNGGTYWSTAGNAGTTPNTDYIGTSDNQALEIRVDGSRILRLEPSAYAPNILAGHYSNSLTAGVYGATLAGGGQALYPNRITDSGGTVGGGVMNQAGDGAGAADDQRFATVGGGEGNTASGYASTVGGGAGNTAEGGSSAVGGGSGNTAGGTVATVAGGEGNTSAGIAAAVAGGQENTSSGDHAAIGGGYLNQADGLAATVPGGRDNSAAGDYSFAAGRHSRANAPGCFVWADTATTKELACDSADRWVARTSGGVYFYTDAGMTSGVYVAAGGGSWASVSDRRLKGNVQPVDGRQILDRLAALPISTWNYDSQDPAIRHIGPMAQDFYAAFGVGEDDTHITTVDADGVALAAIQGLHAENQALKAENQTLRGQVADLDARLAALEKAAQQPGTHSNPLSWLPFGLGLVAVGGGAAAVQRRRSR